MGDNVKVVIRIRPLNDREVHEGSRRCLVAQVERSAITLEAKPKPKTFTYDFVADEDISQDEIFQVVGKPITTSCLSGYNGTVFAYGQTGAGKTHTIIGPEDSMSEERGLLPRCIEFLFTSINREVRRCEGLEFLVKCSFIEIYQEQVIDLLAAEPSSLAVREDIKQGVYVENLTHTCVTSVAETFSLMKVGTQHRHTGSTSMNKESSRSHSVFTLLIESREVKQGLLNFRSSRFHLIDLAGSERQKSTEAGGARLKEAGMINKSLSALGSVINALVDISEGKSRHVHYRDSKLTFLLKDSLGGNSKTCIVAAVSPSASSFGETLSTLKFAQRAKQIKNKAVVNEDLSGNVELLKEQVKQLKEQLKAQGSRPTDYSLIAMNSRVSELEELLEKNLKLRQEAEVALQHEVGVKDELIAKLGEAVSRLEKKTANDKMVLKFRDATISGLQKNLPEETAGLYEEIRLLKESVEMPPIAAKLLAENDQLKGYIENLQRELTVDPYSLCYRLRENQEFTSKLASSLQESAVERAQLRGLLEQLACFKSGELIASPVKRRHEEELLRLRGLLSSQPGDSLDREMLLTEECKFQEHIESLERENKKLNSLLEESSFRLNKSQTESETSFNDSVSSNSVRALKQALKDAARASRLETDLEACRQELEGKELEVSELLEELEILNDAHEFLKDQFKTVKANPAYGLGSRGSQPDIQAPLLAKDTTAEVNDSAEVTRLLAKLKAKEETEVDLKLTITDLEAQLQDYPQTTSRSTSDDLEYYKQEHQTLLSEIDAVKADKAALRKRLAEMERDLAEAALKERSNKAEMERLAEDIDSETKKLTTELTEAYEALLKVKTESEATIARYKLECEALKTLADEADEERLVAVEQFEALQKTQAKELERARSQVQSMREAEEHKLKAVESQAQVEVSLRGQVVKLTEKLTLMTQNETSYVESQKKLDILRRQLDQSKAECSQLKADLASTKTTVNAEKEATRESKSKREAALTRALEDRNGALSDLHTKYQDCMGKLEAMTEENRRLRQQTNCSEADSSELKHKFIESLTNREEVLRQLSALRESEYQTSLENAELKAKWESAIARNAQMNKELEVLNKEIERLGGHANLSQKIKLHSKLKEESNKLKAANYKLTEELRKTKMKLETIHKKFQELVKREGLGEIDFTEDLQLRRELDEVSSELSRTKRGLTKIAEAFGERGLEGSLEDFFERLAASANALRCQVQTSSAELTAKDREITSLNSQLRLLSKEAGLYSYKADLENRTPLTEALNRKHS
jgi:hypothetical protein